MTRIPISQYYKIMSVGHDGVRFVAYMTSRTSLYPVEHHIFHVVGNELTRAYTLSREQGFNIRMQQYRLAQALAADVPKYANKHLPHAGLCLRPTGRWDCPVFTVREDGTVRVLRVKNRRIDPDDKSLRWAVGPGSSGTYLFCGGGQHQSDWTAAATQFLPKAHAEQIENAQVGTVVVSNEWQARTIAPPGAGQLLQPVYAPDTLTAACFDQDAVYILDLH